MFKKVFFALLVALFCVVGITAQAQNYLPFTAAGCITDASGSTLASGTMTIQATDASNNPLPFRAGGNFQTTTAPITKTITNGAVTTFNIANPALTSPQNIRYRISILDPITKRVTAYNQVAVTNNDGTGTPTFNFCKLDTGVTLPALQVTGPVGPPGPPGSGTLDVNNINVNFTPTADDTWSFGNVTARFIGWFSHLWAKYINGVRFADQFPGLDASIKINACVADVIAAGGGICDARGFAGTQAMSQAIAIGNTSSVSVSLLVPNIGSWQWTTNIGSVCAVTLYNKSSIIGNGASGEGAPFSFQGLTGFSGTSVFCTGHASGSSSDSYYRGEGFNVVLNGGAATVAATSIQYGADSSRFQSINTAIYGGSTTPEGLLVDHMCCGASLLNVGVDAGTTATTGIKGGVFGTGNVDLTVVGGSFVHAGPGAQDILFMAGGNNSINLLGTYVEQAANADGTTPQIDHSGAATGDKINFYGLSCLMQNLNTAYCLHQATGTAYMDVYGMLIRGEGSTQFAINDELAGVQITVGAGGIVAPYSSVIAFGNSQTYNTVKYSSGGLLDKDFNLLLNAGKTVATNSAMCLQSMGVSKWCFQKQTNESLAVTDTANAAYQRLILNAGTNSILNSLGANSVDFNESTNSGTNGIRIGSGGASITTVASINGSGLGVFNGGVKAGSSTVASLPSAASSTGTMRYVTDSTTVSAEGQTCAGSGAATALAFSNGVVWKCF